MVAFAARSKWKRGWRRLRHLGTTSAGTTQDDDAFAPFWQQIHLSLASPDRPLPPPPRNLAFLDNDPELLRFVLAPMVLQSERAFRLMVKRYGVGLCFTPMLLAQTVVLKENGEVSPYVAEILRPCAEDLPLMAQLAGSDSQLVLAAAQQLWQSGNISGIDLNLGCPQTCAALGGYGAYLAANDPATAVAMVRVLTTELGVPVSCKLRCVGGMERTVALAKALEAAGACLLTVHGRTPRQRDHQSPSDLDVIRAVRDAVRIPVLANGNCRTKEDAELVLQYTGCEGIMSAVGLLRNPRLFSNSSSEASPLSSSGTLAEPLDAFVCALEYLSLAEEHPPPEARCIRDHLQVLVQGVLQFQQVALWDLMGSDLMVEVQQFRELLRLAAATCGVLEGIEEGGGHPLLTMQEIKRLHRQRAGQEDREEESMAWGGLFGEEEEEEKEEEEEEADEKNKDEEHEKVEVAYALEVQVPWSCRLLDGSKTIETRAYDLPGEVWGEPILLVESPGGGGLARHGLDAGIAVGIVVFRGSKLYAKKEEWALDAAKHGVDPLADAVAFGWSEGEPKYGWEVDEVEVFEEETCKPIALREEQRLVRSLFRLLAAPPCRASR